MDPTGVLRLTQLEGCHRARAHAERCQPSGRRRDCHGRGGLRGGGHHPAEALVSVPGGTVHPILAVKGAAGDRPGGHEDNAPEVQGSVGHHQDHIRYGPRPGA
eukprot:scaffold663373_cov46-Prasinocladus_malaysianus.AAC.1